MVVSFWSPGFRGGGPHRCKVPFAYSHQGASEVHTSNLPSHPWWYLARVSTVKLLLEGSPYAQSTPSRWGVMLYLPEDGVSMSIICSSIWEILSLFPTFTYLFILLWAHGFIFYTLGYNSRVYFVASLVDVWLWELFPLMPVSLWHTPSARVFEHFLPFSPNKMLQAHLVYFLPQPHSQPFLWAPFIGEWY